MRRFILFLILLAILAVAALVAYGYFGDLPPPTETVETPASGVGFSD